MGGDPYFVGLHGQHFGFAGHPNGTYDIYSDATLAVGSRFGVANPATGRGTVMKDIGLRWARHTLSFAVDATYALSADRRAITIELNGKAMHIAAGKSAYDFRNLTGDACTWVAWQYPNLRLLLGAHHMAMITVAKGKDAHINTTYVNLALDVPHVDASLVGGVLGYSASATVLHPAAREADVATPTLFGDAKSTKYVALPLECRAPVAGVQAASSVPKRTAQVTHSPAISAVIV